MKAQTIVILGLNRMGASIALALKNAALEVTLIGYDADRDVARMVKDELQAIDRVEWNLTSAASRADILVVTLPAAEAQDGLQAAGAVLQEHTLVLDMSGLKQQGQQLAADHFAAGHYVAAHPVMGAEWLADGRTGARYATPDLFKQSAFCLMPAADADPQAVESAATFGILLGSLPYFVEAAEFDRLMQGPDLLPGIVALALFRTLANETGWRDMLRLAGMPFTVATAALTDGNGLVQRALADPQAALHWLDRLQEQLAGLRRQLQAGDEELLRAIVTETDIEREKWLRSRQKNEWDERTMPRVQQRSFNEHMLGGWIAGSRDEKEE